MNTRSQLNFLLQALQATAENVRNPQPVVYSLLRKNLDKLDDNLAKLLRIWAAETLPHVELDRAQFFAAVIFLFSQLIEEFLLPSRASNLEIAIAGYEVALTVFTQEAFPEQWARTQNCLGVAYGNRSWGNRAENPSSPNP